MIGERIKSLREKAGMSQAELARKLGTTRASVNAWESGLSAPTAMYIIELSQLFHVTSDYILGLDSKTLVDLSTLSKEESKILYSLISFFEKKQYK